MATVNDQVINYSELVEENGKGFRVNGRVYHDPQVFDEEMDRIYHRGWVFVGHDSEVAEPGDYITRLIGNQPVIMSRDGDGQVHLLLKPLPPPLCHCVPAGPGQRLYIHVRLPWLDLRERRAPYWRALPRRPWRLRRVL